MITSIAPDHKNNPFLDNYAKMASAWDCETSLFDGEVNGEYSEYGIEFETIFSRDHLLINLKSKLKMENITTNVIPLRSPVVGETNIQIQGLELPDFEIRRRTIITIFKRFFNTKKWSVAEGYIIRPAGLKSELFELLHTNPSDWKIVGISNAADGAFELRARSYFSPEDLHILIDGLAKLNR